MTASERQKKYRTNMEQRGYVFTTMFLKEDHNRFISEYQIEHNMKRHEVIELFISYFIKNAGNVNGHNNLRMISDVLKVTQQFKDDLNDVLEGDYDGE